MQEINRSKSRKKKKAGGHVWILLGGGAAAALAILAGTYLWIGRKYETKFFPNTLINGMDASDKTAEEVKQMISSGIEGYSLTIVERGGESERITGSDIKLQAVFDGSLEKMLESQAGNAWLKHLWKTETYEIPAMIQYDQELLQKTVEELNCFDEEKITAPQDARISEYVPGRGFSILPEVKGNDPLLQVVMEEVEKSVLNLKETLVLENAGGYREPEVTGEDEALRKLVSQLNQYSQVQITYTFGESSEVLTGDRIASWLTVENGQIILDRDQVASYVKELASKYDTFNKAKMLRTSYGPEIRVTGGSYGWRINQSAETEELAAVILSGQSQAREPVYAQTAASHGDKDYGETYVEINLTAQHLYYYKDGELVVESDFVSGNLAKGHGTPAGTYSLAYKERNATLKGEDYRTPVDYWMPFNGGIGLHDATWRSSFGGNIYKTSGSHGCVNLPHPVAKNIFENISPGTPVICYFLPGTETEKSTEKTPPKQTAAPETAAPTTAAPETTAPPESTAPPETSTAPEETAPGPTGATAGATLERPKGPGLSESGTGGAGGERGPGVAPAESSTEIGPGIR